MAEFYADENFPQPATDFLRRLNHDVLTTPDSGKAGQSIPDEAVLEYAAANHRILLTLNRKHFIRLHTENANHAGIVICTFDADFEALAVRIDKVVREQGDPSGTLMRVNRPAK